MLASRGGRDGLGTQVRAAIVSRLQDDASAMRGPGDSAAKGEAQPFPFEAAREYMQQDEQPGFKKKGRKKRARRAAADDDDEARGGHGDRAARPDAAEADGGGGDVFAQLEATGGADLGDRCGIPELSAGACMEFQLVLQVPPLVCWGWVQAVPSSHVLLVT